MYQAENASWDSWLLSAAESSPRPVMVIGLDGGTWDVFRELSTQGVMPHLVELCRQGASFSLRSTTPWLTPAAWSTFLTGTGPERHGVWDFFRLDGSHGALVLNRSDHLAVPTLLEQFALEGREVVSIDLPMTWPPPVPGAWILGGFDAPSAGSVLAAAPDFAAALERAGVPWLPQPRIDRAACSLPELERLVRDCCRVMANRVQVARVAHRSTAWQLLIVQFQVLDAFLHRCWPHVEQAARAGVDCSPEAKVCGEFFRRLDGYLGQLLHLARDRGAAVVVLSDHGFGPNRGRVNAPWQLQQLGLLRPAGTVGRAAFRFRHFGWKLRRWGYKRLRGRKTRTLARPLRSQFAWDWSRSQVLPLHGDLGTMLYLNDQRRFPWGKPLSAPQRERLIQETAQGLLSFRCPETGEPLWHEVLDLGGQFDTDPLEHDWPDLVAVPTPGWNTLSTRLVSGGPCLPEPQLPGTHHPQGMLLVAELPPKCATAAEAASGEAHLSQVARLVSALAGLERGQPPCPPLPSVCKTGEVSAGPAWGRPGLTAEEQEQIERRLRSLGYLE